MTQQGRIDQDRLDPQHSRTSMDLIAQERDRLLRTIARAVSVTCTIISAVAVVCASVTPLPQLVAALACMALMLVAIGVIGHNAARSWTVTAVLAGLAAMVVLLASAHGDANRLLMATALVPLASGGLPTLIVVQRNRPVIRTVIAASGIVTIALIAWSSDAIFAETVYQTALGWTLASLVAYWVSRAMARVARRIVSIGNVHRAERAASETEAQRRQSARLLHDTVLATLTLLAHSGVGVPSDALRAEAAEGARMLRHLRLGGSVAAPPPDETHELPVTGETALGSTLESVQQRFGRMGLDVSWHGTGWLPLRANVLDAFLLALSECLENVRRHAGVREAHVTIVEDEHVVRAIVTDAGVGFDVAAIAPERLGFTESVVNRLREVHGDARLFSAPGAGTTVVLEVPR